MKKIVRVFRFIASYPSRLFNGISFRATVVDAKIDRTAKIQHAANVRYSEIGRYSYIAARSSVIHTKIGKFCSVASGVAIGGGAHDLSAVSTSPVFLLGENIFGKNFGFKKFQSYKETIIGNDVWIGNRTIILQGVAIGDGAVIGAGSVVTKDVEPYAVVAGNPARQIKMRFDSETVETLERLKWWDQNDKWLKQYGNYFNEPQMLINNIGEKTI